MRESPSPSPSPSTQSTANAATLTLGDVQIIAYSLQPHLPPHPWGKSLPPKLLDILPLVSAVRKHNNIIRCPGLGGGGRGRRGEEMHNKDVAKSSEEAWSCGCGSIHIPGLESLPSYMLLTLNPIHYYTGCIKP